MGQTSSITVEQAQMYLTNFHQQLKQSIKGLKQNRDYSLVMSIANIDEACAVIKALQNAHNDVVSDRLNFNADNIAHDGIYNRLDFDYAVTPHQRKTLTAAHFEQHHPNIKLTDARQITIGNNGVAVFTVNQSVEKSMRSEILDAYQSIKHAVDWPKLLNRK